jgi:hypothetical protein
LEASALAEIPKLSLSNESLRLPSARFEEAIAVNGWTVLSRAELLGLDSVDHAPPA